MATLKGIAAGAALGPAALRKRATNDTLGAMQSSAQREIVAPGGTDNLGASERASRFTTNGPRARSTEPNAAQRDTAVAARYASYYPRMRIGKPPFVSPRLSAMKRAVRLGYISYAGVVILPLIVFWPGARSIISASGIPTMAITLVVMFGPLLAGFAIQRRALSRIRRAVTTSKGRSCMRCVYNLRGLGETGACPECGHPFCIDEDRELWSMAGFGRNEAMYPEGGTKLAPIPPAIKRQFWWFALPGVLVAKNVAELLVPAWGNAASASSLNAELLYGAATLASGVLAIVLIVRGQRRAVRAVQTTGGRSCVKCVHDLRGLGDTGTCPTCKRPFDTVADQCSWARVKMLK